MSDGTRLPIHLARRDSPGSLAGARQAIESWLGDRYGADSGSDDDQVLVDAASTEESGAGSVYTLSVTDSEGSSRLGIALIQDPVGDLIFVDEAPLGSSEGPKAIMELSDGLIDLLGRLGSAGSTAFPLSTTDSDDGIDRDQILSDVSTELRPGLIVLVTDPEHPEPKAAQREVVANLPGIAHVRTLDLEESRGIADSAGYTGTLAPGSVLSIARGATGDETDAEYVNAFSLRTQARAARRLILRHQLAAAIPFSAEQVRSRALRSLARQGDPVDLDTALELLEEESTRNAALQAALAQAQLSVERAWEDQEQSLKELDEVYSRLRFLEKAFREMGEFPVGEPEPDEGWLPDTCVDAIEAAKELLPYLRISAAADPIRELDRHPKHGIWAKKIWASLRAMNDYVRAKCEGGFSGDLGRYREDPPADAIPLPCEYAAKESESTSSNPETRRVREFVVDDPAAEPARRYMEAHLKIDRGGAAPRVHLFDDSGGSTQRVHVGYVGPHLPTSGGY